LVIAMKVKLLLFAASSFAVYFGFQALSFLWVAFGLALFLIAARRHKKPAFSIRV
jgi:hypothetical protein